MAKNDKLRISSRVSLEDVKRKAVLHRGKDMGDGNNTPDEGKQEETGTLFGDSRNIEYEVLPSGKAVIKHKNKSNDKIKSINIDDILDDILGVHKFNINKVKRAKELIHNFPDLGLAREIYVSSILSPNLLSTITFKQKITSNWLPKTVSAKLLAYLSEELTNYYDLDNRLYNMTEESLVNSGAYCEVLIPDNSLEKHIRGVLDVEDLNSEALINTQVMEHITKADETSKTIGEHLTLFSSSEAIGLIDEHYTYESAKKKQDSKSKDIEKFFMEVNAKNSVPGRALPVNESTDNKTRPLRMSIPMESVIPIHVKSDPSKHLGYFIVLDEDGSPIRNIEEITVEVDAAEKVFNGEILTNSQYQESQKKKKVSVTKTPTLKKVSELSQEILTKKVSGFLESKGLEKYIDDDLANTLYKIMFFRANKALKTNVLYVPKEELFYMAFEYDDNGSGVSILDTMGDLATDRMALITAKLHAQIKNLIPDTLYDVTLEEDDQDPEATVKEIILSILESRGGTLPNMNGSLDRVSYANWAQKLGISLKVNHPKLPNIEINKDVKYNRYEEPDNDFEDEIKAKMYMKFSLTAEMVTKGMEGEFATSVRINNALFTKRIIQKQLEIEQMLTDYIKMIIRNDAVVFNNMTNIIKESYETLNKSFTKEAKTYLKDRKIDSKDMLSLMLEEATNTYKLSLMRPEDETKEMLEDAYDTYVDFVEEYLERTISEDSLPDKFLEVFDGDIDKLRMFTHNKLVNKWMAENNYYPELINLFSYREDGTPETEVFEDYNYYAKSIVESFEAYKKSLSTKESFYKESEDKEDLDTVEPNDPNDPNPPTDEVKLPEPSSEDKESNSDITTNSWRPKVKRTSTNKSSKLRNPKKSIVGRKAHIYSELLALEDLNTESHTEELDNNALEIDVKLKDLYQLSLEFSVGSTRKLLQTMKGKGSPNKYHARVCCDLLYDKPDINDLVSVTSKLKELASEDPDRYYSFLRALVRQNYANNMSIKLFGKHNRSPIGISPVIRDMINGNVFKECGVKFNTSNSLYVNSVMYKSIVDGLRTMLENLTTDFSSIDNNIEIDYNNSNYVDILDPNSIYYIGERYIAYESSNNLRAIYHDIDVNKTIELQDAVKRFDIKTIKGYGINLEENDIESLKLYAVIDGKAINLADTKNLEWLPNSDRKVINPIHSQRARLMLKSYNRSLEIEYENANKIDKKEYTSSKDIAVMGIIELHSRESGSSLKDIDIDHITKESNNINLALLIHYAIAKENSRDGKYSHAMLEELRTIFNSKQFRDYTTESYFKNNITPVDIGTDKEIVDIPWNSVKSVIDSVLTAEIYSNEEIGKNSPLANFVYAKASHISEMLKVRKREAMVRILDIQGFFIDPNGKRFDKAYFYPKGELSEDRVNTVYMPFDNYGISNIEFRTMLDSLNLNRATKDLPEEEFDVDSFIELIKLDEMSKDALRRQLEE